MRCATCYSPVRLRRLRCRRCGGRPWPRHLWRNLILLLIIAIIGLYGIKFYLDRADREIKPDDKPTGSFTGR